MFTGHDEGILQNVMANRHKALIRTALKRDGSSELEEQVWGTRVELLRFNQVSRIMFILQLRGS